jgi:hypothetical protein
MRNNYEFIKRVSTDVALNVLCRCSVLFPYTAYVQTIQQSFNAFINTSIRPVIKYLATRVIKIKAEEKTE